jgi:hypothetical protein
MADEPVPVFLSVGRPFRPEHQMMLDKVTGALDALGLSIRTAKRDEWTFQRLDNPLSAVRSLMRECHGALVVTFARTRFTGGYEWPDSEHQLAISARSTTTVWNHMEAAMAFQIGVPILLLREARVHPEGMLDPLLNAVPIVTYDLDDCQQALPDSLHGALSRFANEVKLHSTAR